MLTKLQAINAILENLGLTTVTSLNASNVDARAALVSIDLHTNLVQAPGWWFNEEKCVSLPVDILGKIFLPANVLSVDTSSRYGPNIVQRGNKLYDVKNRTNVFTGPVEVDMIVALEWDDLPYNIKNVVQFASMLKVQTNLEGDQIKIASIEGSLLGAMNEARAEDLRNRDINKFQSSHVSRILRGGRQTAARDAGFIGGLPLR